MSFSFNGNTPKVITFNNQDVKKIVYNNVLIWQKGRLPNEYQEVEWIKGSGFQYINTGIIGKPSITVDCKMLFESTSETSNCGMLGCRQNSGDSRFYIISAYQNKWHVGMKGDSGGNAIEKNTLYNIHFANTENKFWLEVNDIVEIEKTATQFTEYPMYLFACNNYGNAARYTRDIRLYYMIIYVDGNQVRNFIPCYRKSDGEIGMYDIVSEKFFTNDGTGSFAVGNNI